MLTVRIVFKINNIYYRSSPIGAKFGPDDFTVQWLPSNYTVRALPTSGGGQPWTFNAVNVIRSWTAATLQQRSRIYKFHQSTNKISSQLKTHQALCAPVKQTVC